jgi:hypothetical protein
VEDAMGERPRSGAREPSGTAGGADVEPLRGGMEEVERGELGPERAPERDRAARGSGRGAAKDPPAPYHGLDVPEGGLAPRVAPGEGAPPPASPRPSPADIDAHAGEKLHQERADHENEAGNARREDVGDS